MLRLASPFDIHAPVVFGLDLEFLLEREGGGEVQPGAIPSVINKLILDVETRGLTEIGICKSIMCGIVTELGLIFM